MKIRAFLIFCLILFTPQLALAKTFQFEAHNGTGANRDKGVPLFLFEVPSGDLVAPGFDTLGEFDPDPAATEAIPLTPATSDSAILATRVDPTAPFAAAPINPELFNVPLRDVKTWTSINPTFTFDLTSRDTPPPHVGAPFFPGISQAEPNDPITLGDWFKAEGKMKIKCNDDGNSVRIKVKGLVPNRLYTVWAVWFIPGQTPPLFPQPLGGVPNAYVTDEHGAATFKRELNFCPPEVAQTGVNGSILTGIATHLHSDHAAYGGIPSPIVSGLTPGQTGLPPGTVLHGQLEWNLGNGVPVDPDGGNDDEEDE